MVKKIFHDSLEILFFFTIIEQSVISISLLGYLILTELFHVCSMMRGDTVNKTSRLCLLHAANSVVG